VTEGSSGTPWLEYRTFPEHRWLEALQKLSADEAATLEQHRRLHLDEDAIIDALRHGKGGDAAARRFHELAGAWRGTPTRLRRPPALPGRISR